MTETEPDRDPSSAKFPERNPNGEPHPIALRSPLEVIQHALNAKLAPAELKEYFDLYRTMRADEAAQAYAEAMAECQKEMPRIVRDKENKGTHSRYASWENLEKIVRPIYSKHGFSLSFTEDPARSTPEGMWMLCHCKHRVGHSETVSGIFPRDGVGPKGGQPSMNAIQAVGSTRSYAKRYLAKDLFALAEADEDDDGNSTSERIGPEQIGILNELLEAKKLDLDRFLAWLFKVPKTEVGKDEYRMDRLNMEQFKQACAQYKWPAEKAGKP